MNKEYFKYKPFSRFHRKFLSAKCWAYDVDFVEMRRNRGIVAFLETKQVPNLKSMNIYKYFSFSQRKMYYQLHNKVKSASSYLIAYNKVKNAKKWRKIKRFWCWSFEKVDRKYRPQVKVKPFPMDRKEFKKFIENL